MTPFIPFGAFEFGFISPCRIEDWSVIIFDQHALVLCGLLVNSHTIIEVHFLTCAEENVNEIRLCFRFTAITSENKEIESGKQCANIILYINIKYLVLQGFVYRLLARYNNIDSKQRQSWLLSN